MEKCLELNTSNDNDVSGTSLITGLQLSSDLTAIFRQNVASAYLMDLCGLT